MTVSGCSDIKTTKCMYTYYTYVFVLTLHYKEMGK